MVELALGSLVFVTVLIFTIHFAEVGFWSLKIQEASVAAVFETTAGMNRPDLGSPRTDRSPEPLAYSRAKMQARYQDFHGLSASSAPATLNQVFTRIERLDVSCRSNASSPLPFPGEPLLYPMTWATFTDNAGGLCSSQGTMTGLRIPTVFLDSSPESMFEAKHYVPRPMTLCGVGRASAGVCEGGFSLLVDDWGLASAQEAEPVDAIISLPGLPLANGNQPFQRMVGFAQELSNVPVLLTGRAFAGTQMVKEYVGNLPLAWPVPGETPILLHAHLSAMGEESAMGPMRDAAAMGDDIIVPDPRIEADRWPTTPGGRRDPLIVKVPFVSFEADPYADAYDDRVSNRRRCFLGQSCE